MGIIITSLLGILILMPILVFKVWPNIFLAILVLVGAVIAHGYANYYSFQTAKRSTGETQVSIVGFSENESKSISKSDYKRMFLYFNEAYGWLFIVIYFLLVVTSIWLVKKYV